MSRIATVLVTGLIVLTLGEATDARSFRPAMLPNAPDGCNTCHTSGGGTPRNAFGLDVEAIVGSSEQQFWSAELAALDSDGDGVSNGWELGDPDGDGDPDPTIPITSPAMRRCRDLSLIFCIRFFRSLMRILVWFCLPATLVSTRSSRFSYSILPKSLARLDAPN